MNTTTFDTLAAARALEEAGMDARQAEVVVGTVRTALTDGVATKADVAALEARLVGRLSEMEARLTWRLLGGIIAGMAALLALFRYLPAP